MSNLSQDPIHTYLDITVSNNNHNASNSNPVPVVFSSRRDADYLTNPSEYLMSVIRWNLELRLPQLVPQLDFLSPNFYVPNEGYQTIYNVGIEFYSIVNNVKTASIVEELPIIFISQNNFKIPNPQPNNMIQVYDDPYFYVDSVQYFMALVNETIKKVYQNAITAWNAVHPPITITAKTSPYFLYNNDGNFSLFALPNFLTHDSRVVQPDGFYMNLFFNSSLYTLFNGFSASIQSFINTLNNYRIQFISENQTSSITLQGDNEATTFLYMISEYPCVPSWSPVSSIIFQSNNIPVEPTNSTPCNIVGGMQGSVSSNNNLNLSPIITDFNVNFQNGTEGRQITYYASPSEYRFFDLNSNRPISDINIIAMWKDKLTGAQHNLYLFSGCGGSMKILFRKKTYFLGY